jgi:hypothetical protein
MARRTLAVNILLDGISRNNMKTNLADLAIYDVNVITSLEELDDVALSKSKVVFLLEEVVTRVDMYSDFLLYKEELSLEFIYIGLDTNLISIMSNVAKCYKMDSSTLDYDKIHAIIYNDLGALNDLQLASFKPELLKLAKDMSTDPNKEVSVRRIAESFVSLHSIMGKMSDELSFHKGILGEKEFRIQKLSEENKELERLYIDITTKAVELNTSLRQYESILSRDVYDKVQLSRYPNRPRIIYLKEYEEIAHFNSFITTLFETFRHHSRDSVKVIRLYDSSSSKKILTLPNYYKQIQNTFSRRDVVSSDFIVKVGGYREILDLLFTNHNNLDVLILVDCKDHTETVISASPVQLAMCRNPEHIPVYNLDAETTIVSSGDSDMVWDHYENYKSMNAQDKFLFLSSRPVIQNIFERDKLFNR